MKAAYLFWGIMTGAFLPVSAQSIDALLKESVTGCFRMTAYYVSSDGLCSPAEELSGDIYATRDIQYAEYTFATVLSDRTHYLSLNHYEKSAFLSINDSRQKKGKGKRKGLKVDGIEILPSDLDYEINPVRIFSDGNQSLIVNFKQGYTYYDRILVHLNPEGKIRNIQYFYVNNPDWQYSELDFTGCDIMLNDQLVSKASVAAYITKTGENYHLNPPFSDYHLQINHPSK